MLLHLLNFHRKRLWEYRLEILAGALRMTVQISVLLLFWSIVGKSATSGILTSDLIAYFLVANGMNELTMAMNLRLCGTIQDGIKSGELSRYILRPVRLLPFLVTETFGRYLVLNSFAILFIGLGMVLKPPTQLGLLLFAPALLC